MVYFLRMAQKLVIHTYGGYPHLYIEDHLTITRSRLIWGFFEAPTLAYFYNKSAGSAAAELLLLSPGLELLTLNNK